MGRSGWWGRACVESYRGGFIDALPERFPHLAALDATRANSEPLYIIPYQGPDFLQVRAKLALRFSSHLDPDTPLGLGKAAVSVLITSLYSFPTNRTFTRHVLTSRFLPLRAKNGSGAFARRSKAVLSRGVFSSEPDPAETSDFRLRRGKFKGLVGLDVDGAETRE